MTASRPAPSTDRRRLLRLSAATGMAAALPGLLPLPARAAADPLTVGGLAVTCNLTLPIACTARNAMNEKSGSSALAYEYSRYNGWPEVKESLMSGRIQAAYMLAPLVMDLADKRIPVKIVSLGHRSGAVIMVRTDSAHQKFSDLAGKRIAIPSRFAVDFLFLRKMLTRENMTPKDVVIVEMAPADMPAALYAKAVDAYCTGEPFGAAAQRAGYAKRAAHDARRMAQLHLLRADRARGADQATTARWCRTWSTTVAGRRQRGWTCSRPTARRRSSRSPPAASSSTRTPTSSSS